MSLERLSVTSLRNLQDVAVELGRGLNLFIGPNGSGKTSLLESAYFLSSGRSFRDINTDPLISRGKDSCLVRGDIADRGVTYRVGIQRHRDGSRDIRINGEKAHRSSELAHLLPVLVLGPGSVDLLLGAPSNRRRFLNWGLFHVKHPGPDSFPKVWEEANRCLKQRNLLLRQGRQNRETLESWTRLLVSQAEQIDRMRCEYIERYEPVFREVAGSLGGMEGLALQYYRGWSAETTLHEIYAQDTENDEKRGYTQKGFQRADVRITVEGQPASKVCSRGELKALVWSMILAQGALTRESGMYGEGHETLYLVDDLASEFDGEHRQRVCHFLAETGQQVMLTGVDQGALLEACEGNGERMFHVKHGQVTLEKAMTGERDG